ncbi:hypothetical protein H7F15_04155 [Pontibacter sp. Tf4]|uniref:hypothetical protein n=1 Tax=Pontibacter sp. Tf4 TaxID=2761620 RepID=UPI001628F687|nr:hypothetical protein [Pontibacter sp. Tf4]MBB6610223.1 hypothetical protein [Pontibacter sp. Tf4]
MALNRILLLLFLTLFTLTFYSCRPACPIMQCNVRMVHPHGEGEYRGVPIWKKQNMKYGEKIKPKKDKDKKNEKDRSKNKS